MREFFEIASRVRVKLSAAEGYKQPWRDRFKRGIEGTVIDKPLGMLGRAWLVEFDHGKVKYPFEWKIRISGQDLELMDPTREGE